VSTPAAAAAVSFEKPRQAAIPNRRPDVFMLAGIAVAVAALVLGIAATGVHLSYFFQPAGALIVVGGTIGVTLITTPRKALLYSIRGMFELLWAPAANRDLLLEEVMSCLKTARTSGLLGLEPLIDKISDPFLKEALPLVVDMKQRAELQATLETKIRLAERQGEADAKTLEVAGGFAPTIGIMGTVVGLINVLGQFSSISSVAAGLGTAFVSTIYGLALANLILLPASHRIRAKAAETFEAQELVAEGMLCVFDRMHPMLVRESLNSFLREADRR
jgi:chemotaxis protein MotA